MLMVAWRCYSHPTASAQTQNVAVKKVDIDSPVSADRKMLQFCVICGYDFKDEK